MSIKIKESYYYIIVPLKLKKKKFNFKMQIFNLILNKNYKLFIK